ncbi:hypothetical protein [Cereibacter sphaeroides]|uniref:hypothetical protein n=1 Tax=Cereibacter sphaeroides TaxID=1063 RepID=UPI0002E577B0|nr:hypothetical protein [Cereibacter sphaeroides]RHZ95281.1 hypothetical protein D1122_14580 [Cereibacter sphaeroides]
MVPARRLFAGLGVTLLLSVPQITEASNDTARASASRGTVHTQSAGTFNWLTPPAVTRASVRTDGARTEGVRTRRQIGNGSWICSPAGFGRGSRCYAN